MGFLRAIFRLAPCVAFVAVLLVPLAQQVFGFAPPATLGGKVQPDPEVPESLFAGWHDGSLEQYVDAKASSGLGLRGWMVRLDNQLKYSLLGVTKRPVVGGRDGWLYEEDYLTPLGVLTPGWGNVILGRAFVLWSAQQVLAENGVTMVVVVSPSKVETYPEHLPAFYDLARREPHPHCLGLLRALGDAGILNLVDGQQMFTQWHREDPAAPLFTRCGTHWTHIGAGRVIARLIDRLEELSGVDLVNVDFAGVKPRQVMADHDLLDLANLLDADRYWRPEDEVGAAVLKPRPGDHGQPAGILLVASSFGWLMTENLGDPAYASPMTMHYYFRTAYDVVDGRLGPSRPVDRSPAALRAEILRHRFVVLEWNAAKYLSSYEFPEAVLAAFGPPKAPFPKLPPDKQAAIDRAIVEPFAR